MQTKTNNYKKIILFSFLGIIWSLSNIGYVKYFGSNFALFTLVPFLLFIRKEKIKNAFFYASIFGFFAYIVHFWWMIIPMVLVVGGNLLPAYLSFLGIVLGLLLVIFLSFFQGLYYFFVHFLSMIFSRKNEFLYYILFVLFGTVLDYFFPKIWGDYLGYSQYNNFYYVQIVDLFGVSFLTFFVLLINSTVAWSIDIFVIKRVKSNLFYKFSLVFMLLMLIVLPFYGYMRINEVSKIINKTKSINVGIAQGNNSGLDKKRKEKINDMVLDYNELTNKFDQDKIDLVVWPESAIPYWFLEDKTEFRSVKDNNVKALIFGTHIMTKMVDKNYSIYNSLLLLDKYANKVDFYYKNKLLPFTEEVPYLFGWVFKLLNLKSFSKGEGPKILSINGYNFSPNICYEAIKEDYIRKSIFKDNKISHFIVNATNDSWFGNSIEPEMHLVISSFRAIENRRYMVRATCTGYSAIVDPFGRILKRIDLGQKDIIESQIHLLEIRTFYNSFGYLFIYILGIFVVILVFVFVIKEFFNYKKNVYIYKEVTYKENLKKIWNE